jgi:hypothetical protein
VARTSALVHAATDDGDGDTADGDGDAGGVGLADGDGLGVTGLPHAATIAAPNTIMAVIRETWGRRVRAIEDRIIRLPPGWSDDPTGLCAIRPQRDPSHVPLGRDGL